jgi:hypothetical protein
MNDDVEKVHVWVHTAQQLNEKVLTAVMAVTKKRIAEEGKESV